MKTDVYFNTIYVIQSLNDDERQTGLNLFENVLKYKSWQHKNIKVRVYDINIKTQFLNLLNSISFEITKLNELPYLHFEMHGSKNKDGLVLKNGELIKWNELSNSLRNINIKSKNNLFISMATCYGSYLIKAYNQFNEPCPFYGFVGPSNNIGDRDLEDSYADYFTTLLDTKDFTLAIKALQASNVDNPNEYTFLNSEGYFDLIVKNLQKDSEKIKARKALYNSFRKDKRFSSLSNNKLRALIERTQLIEEDKIIEEMKAIFIIKEKTVTNDKKT